MTTSPQKSGKWLKFLLLLICLINLGTYPIAYAQNANLEHPEKLLKENHQQILQLSSDKDALRFHQAFISPLLQHEPSRQKPSRGSQVPQTIPQDMQATITTFWAAMTFIGYVQEFHAVPESPVDNHFLTKILPGEAQRQWLHSKPSLERFMNLVEFQNQLSTWTKQEPVAPPPDHNFSQFERLYNHIDSSSSRQTWISLFNDLGFKGIQAKLGEYWQQYHQQDLQFPVSNSLKQSSIQNYIESRLLPIFHVHLLTQANQVEAQAYNVAWRSWHRIQQWEQQERTHHAMRRLCGTWKWIIHNHQNHGDHKTTMTFMPPGQSTPPQVQPSTIRVHGDTVYLRWIFPQGIQEDSLLLSNRDTRLEGTFTNSLGPHGSISGQRLSHCKN